MVVLEVLGEDAEQVRYAEHDEVYWSTDFGMSISPIGVGDPEAPPRDRGRPGLVGFLPAGFRRWTHLYKVRGVTIEIRSLVAGPTLRPKRMSRARRP